MKSRKTDTDQILESISDGVFTVDDDWRITSFNQAAERITGYNREDVFGKPCREVFKTDICDTDCYLRRSMQTGERIIAGRATIINSHGEKIPITISTAPLIDEDGTPCGGAETFRDMSVEVQLRNRLTKTIQLGGIVTHNATMHTILNMIPAIADSMSTVLIRGDTGTGKEVLAKAIHAAGARADKPFIAINCGALPDTLLESELFGYKAGAFTGATKDRSGRIQAAEGGTLFLDEVGDVSPAFQVKLLRFLQERTYETLGSNDTRTADVRVITATHRDLSAELEKGTFRKDLFYRINVVRIILPPLHERRDDVPLLVDRFIETFNVRTAKRIKCVSASVISLFMAYPWPGNVRELENAIEFAFVTCTGDVIEEEHIPPEIRHTHTVPSVPKQGGFDQAERLVLETALRQNDYSRRKTAEQLNVHPSTLFRKIKRFGIVLPHRDGRYRSEP